MNEKTHPLQKGCVFFLIYAAGLLRRAYSRVFR